MEEVRARTENLRDLMGRKVSLTAIESPPATEDILNAILPPREWVNEGEHLVQYVSHTQASRLDVADLTKYLNIRLSNRQARHNKNDICPVKQELYDQCFNEIIR